MARLNATCDSDEEFPDVATILHPPGKAVPQTPRKGSRKEHGNRIPLGDGGLTRTLRKIAAPEDTDNTIKSLKKFSCDKKQSSRQRSLGTAQVNSLLLPITNERLVNTKSPELLTSVDRLNDVRQVRSSLRKTARQPVNYSIFTPQLSSASGSDEESYRDNLSDFIVNDSASETENGPSRSPKRCVQPAGKMSTLSERPHKFVIDDPPSDEEDMPLQKPRKDTQRPLKNFAPAGKPHLPFPGHSFSGLNLQSEVIDLTSPAKLVATATRPDSIPQRQSTSIEPGSFEDSNHNAAPAVLQLYVDYRSSIFGFY